MGACTRKMWSSWIIHRAVEAEIKANLNFRQSKQRRKNCPVLDKDSYKAEANLSDERFYIKLDSNPTEFSALIPKTLDKMYEAEEPGGRNIKHAKFYLLK